MTGTVSLLSRSGLPKLDNHEQLMGTVTEGDRSIGSLDPARCATVSLA
jgi:hypothetical protein